jgi:hypothetical protein
VLGKEKFGYMVGDVVRFLEVVSSTLRCGSGERKREFCLSRIIEMVRETWFLSKAFNFYCKKNSWFGRNATDDDLLTKESLARRE